MIDSLLQPVLNFVVPILAVALLVALSTLALNAWTKFKLARPDIAKAIEDAAAMAVKAAEQSGIGGIILNEAKAKKELALDIAQRYLDAKGIKVDIRLLEAAIEAAVWSEFNKDNPAKNLRLPHTPYTELLTKTA